MKKLNLVFIFLFAVVSFAYSQRTVSGTITDEGGEPLIGASIVADGTTTGTVTDFDGKYTLNVPEGVEKLVFSYTGFATQIIDLDASNVVDVVMAEGVDLSEVVVTALGIKREKKSLGYATQEIDADEVTRVKDANFVNSLSGKVAGVDIKKSGNLGGSANVIIRGFTSLSGNNQALFVVDGVPIDNTVSASEDPINGDQNRGRGGYDYGNAAMDINPEDIESINVLKGAAATALYGSRGSTGVILITTKKGTKGKKGIGVTLSTGATFGNIDKTTMPRYQTEYGPGYSTIQGWYAQDGFEFYDFGDGPQLSTAVYEDASYGPAFSEAASALNWESYYEELSTFGQPVPYEAAANDPTSFYETSTAWNTNVSIDGGMENGSYRLSFTNYNTTGIVPNSSIKRNTVSFAGGYDLTDKLSVTSSVNYVLSDGRGRYGTGYDARNFNQSFRQWYSVNTDMKAQEEAYLATGKNISWNPYGPLDPDRATVPHYFDNYYFTAFENFSTDSRDRVFGNITLNYELTDWLNIMGRVSADRYDEIQEERIAVGSVDVSKYARFDRRFNENNYDLILNFNKYVGSDNKINVNGLLGTNIRRTQVESSRAQTNGGLVVPGLYALRNSVSPIEAPDEKFEPLQVNGYFAKAGFGFDQMLYVDLSARYDISSTLPAENNAYFYPSASLTFIFSELMNNSSFFDFGKVRLNYAEVGNDTGFGRTRDIFDINTPFNGVPLASATATKRNPGLLPERTKSLEAGVDMRFWKDRVGVDISVYKANTFDQIYRAATTGAAGYTFEWINAGELENKGIEAALRVTPVKTSDFRWDMNINWAKNVNTVVSLGDGRTNLQLASVQGGVTINATVGESYGAIWGTDFVYHTDGSPIVYPHWNGGVRYRKTSTPGVVGDINPDWKGGINNTLRYKDLSFSFLIDMQKGGDFFSLDTWYGTATGIYDFTAGTNRNGVEVRALPADGGGIFIDGAVVQTGEDENGVPISDGTVNEEAFYASDVYNSLGYVYAPTKQHVYDASFVKLREVALTYSFPASVVDRTPFTALDLSLIGRNLWIIHKNSEYSDPEAGLSAGNIQGNQSGAYPAVREYGFNLRLKF